MEYSINNGETWKAITGTYITRSDFGVNATTVIVRRIATAALPSSNITSIAAPGAATTSPSGVTLDTRSESVTGVSNLMEYSTNGTSWKSISSNPLLITSLIPAASARADITLSIRIKAASGNPASLPTVITLPRRPSAPTAADVKYLGLTETISATSQMEYRVGSTGGFTSVTGETGIPASAGASARSIQVRIMATDTAFASTARTVSAPARRAAPSAVYNGSTDRITGVTGFMEFCFENETTWTTVTGTSITRDEIGDAPAVVLVRTKATATLPSSNIGRVIVPGAATASPEGITLDTYNETVTGVSSLMEYSTNGTRWTAISANPLSITSMIPAATASGDVTLSIRLKSVGGNPASLPADIVLPRRPATPSAAAVRFDGLTEAILVTDDMEFRTDTGGSYTRVAAGETQIPVSAGETAQSYQVRVRATDATFVPAQPRTVTVPARGAAPGAAYNGSTDSITGVSAAMEYSLDDGEAWETIGATAIPRTVFGDASTTVMVRTKATEAAPSSGIKAVAVPNAATTYPTGITLDTRAEIVTGLSDFMEFSTNGTSWTAIAANTLSITSLIQTENDVTLRIRYKAETGEPASLPCIVTLPRRPATPAPSAVKFDGLTETISLNDSMEYRANATEDFTSVAHGATTIPLDVGASAQSYQVRAKATDTVFASGILAVAVPARAAAPVALYDGLVDKITGVSSAMEYSLNDGTAWASASETSIPRNVFGGVAATVLIRIKATATAPSSYIRSVNVPGKDETFPTGVALDPRSETVTGVSNLMEYSTNGTSWTTVAANPLDISSMIPVATASDGVMLSIRFRAAGGKPASFAVSINIPRRPAAPTATAVKFDGLSETIAANSQMEFRAGTSGSFSAVPSGDTKVPVIVGTASQSYQVRYKATDTSFVSATLAVTVPARAAAPNAVFNSTQNAITGVSGTMEYSLNNGATWVSASGTTIPRSVFGSAETTVMVRVKATTAAPSSAIKNVEVPKA